MWDHRVFLILCWGHVSHLFIGMVLVDSVNIVWCTLSRSRGQQPYTYVDRTRWTAHSNLRAFKLNRFLPCNATPRFTPNNHRTDTAGAGTEKESTFTRISTTAPSRLEPFASDAGVTSDDASLCSPRVYRRRGGLFCGYTDATDGLQKYRDCATPMASRNSDKIRYRVRPRPLTAVCQRGNDLHKQRSYHPRPRTITSRGETTRRALRNDGRGKTLSWGGAGSSSSNTLDNIDKQGKSSANGTFLMGNHEGKRGIGRGASGREYVSRPPLLATSPLAVQQEADDGLLQGGLLWEESQFARVMELRRLAMEGAARSTTDACQPVGMKREILG